MTTMLEDQLAVFDVLRNIPRVVALNHFSDRDFAIATKEQALDPIIDNNDVIIVTGGYFGDEGKGKITDAIARDPRIKFVARVNSGENAGHTVEDIIFNLAPSGLLNSNIMNLVGPECEMDPVNFMVKEIGQLLSRGINYKNNLVVGNVHVVGPYHKILDFALSPPNTSTIMGMSDSHASKVKKRGLRLNDLFNLEDGQRRLLEKDLKTYFAQLSFNGKKEEDIAESLHDLEKDRKVSPHLFEFLAAKDKVDFLIELYKKHVSDNPNFPVRGDTIRYIREALTRGEKGILESPQSYWLSNATVKHWGSSTSAHTHATGVLASSGINPFRYKTVAINVMKTPADSRVGAGANPSSFVPQNYFSGKGVNKLADLGEKCLDFDLIQRTYHANIQSNGILKPVEFSDATGTYSISEAMAMASSRTFGERGATTGKPRVTGLFDCVAAYQVNEAQGPLLTISAMDRGNMLDQVGMTVAYVVQHPKNEIIDSDGKKYHNGDIIKIGDEYPCDNVLKYCHPIVKVMPGWKNTPIKTGDTDLPISVKRFIGTIEDLTGFQVIAIGVGKKNTDLIYIKRK